MSDVRCSPLRLSLLSKFEQISRRTIVGLICSCSFLSLSQRQVLVARRVLVLQAKVPNTIQKSSWSLGKLKRLWGEANTPCAAKLSWRNRQLRASRRRLVQSACNSKFLYTTLQIFKFDIWGSCRLALNNNPIRIDGWDMLQNHNLTCAVCSGRVCWSSCDNELLLARSLNTLGCHSYHLECICTGWAKAALTEDTDTRGRTRGTQYRADVLCLLIWHRFLILPYAKKVFPLWNSIRPLRL